LEIVAGLEDGDLAVYCGLLSVPIDMVEWLIQDFKQKPHF
jgi:hypothetical protein